MKSVKVKAFLSCSLHDDDKDVTELVRALCKGMDIECFTVDRAHVKDPATVARTEIKARPVFIAIATRRDVLSPGKFATSDAIKEEISFAHAFQKNIVLIRERDVADGSMSRVSELVFNRSELTKPEFIEKLVSSLHEGKMAGIQPHELLLEQGPSEYFIEELTSLRELVESGDGYIWHFSTTRRLKFAEDYDRSLKYGAWPSAGSVTCRNGEPDVTFQCGLSASSRQFKEAVEIEKVTPAQIELRMKLDPSPVAGDYLTLTMKTRSKYFAPIYKCSGAKPLIRLKGRSFSSLSGCVAPCRVQRLKLCYIFPEGYVRLNDLSAFASVYFNSVDEPLDYEIRRIKMESEEISGKIIAKIEIEEPHVGYEYGLDWNPLPEGNDPYHATA